MRVSQPVHKRVYIFSFILILKKIELLHSRQEYSLKVLRTFMAQDYCPVSNIELYGQFCGPMGYIECRRVFKTSSKLCYKVFIYK